MKNYDFSIFFTDYFSDFSIKIYTKISDFSNNFARNFDLEDSRKRADERTGVSAEGFIIDFPLGFKHVHKHSGDGFGEKITHEVTESVVNVNFVLFFAVHDDAAHDESEILIEKVLQIVTADAVISAV